MAVRRPAGLLAGLLVAGLTTGACTAGGPETPTTTAATIGATRAAPNAAAAGGACLLLDFAATNQALGTAFDVAAAGGSGQTASCVLRSAKAEYPMLSVALTPTKADVATFQSTSVWPKGGEVVGNLGKVAYRLPTRAEGDHGPGIEVCWLSGNARLITLRVVAGKGKTAPAYQKVVAVAQLVDKASV